MCRNGRSAMIALCCIFGMMVSLVVVPSGQHGMSENAAGQLDFTSDGPARVEVKPLAPRTGDNVTLIKHMYLTAGTGINTTISQNGTSINITFLFYRLPGIWITVMLHFSYEIPLGQLDHGDYIVNITMIYDRHDGTQNTYYQSGSFIVADGTIQKSSDGKEKVKYLVET